MRLAIITGFWQREEVTREFCAHYRALRYELSGEVSLDLVAAHSQDWEYLRAIDSSYWVTPKVANRPLAAKFNRACERAGEWEERSDGVILTGSDDFMDAAYVRWCAEQLATGYDMGGALDIHFYRRTTGEAIHWPGYSGAREGEPIGAGRFMSARMLDRVDWRPWPEVGDRGLDGALWERMKVVHARTTAATLAEIGGKLVDVKDGDNITDWWALKHAPGVTEVDADGIGVPAELMRRAGA